MKTTEEKVESRRKNILGNIDQAHGDARSFLESIQAADTWEDWAEIREQFERLAVIADMNRDALFHLDIDRVKDAPVESMQVNRGSF